MNVFDSLVSLVVVISVIGLIYWIGAVVSLVRAKTLPPTTRAVWALTICSVPILGALLWFWIGKEDAKALGKVDQ